LLNTLTDAGVLAEDKLFATLDTRARKLTLPDGKDVVLTDTVGFIRGMPKDLFAAFRATFEEASEADLILEVVDASDPEQQEHLDTTSLILSGLDLDRTARLRVYNKIDRVPPEEVAGFEAEPNSVCISALQRETTTQLLDRVSEELAKVLSERAREAREAAQYAEFAENELSL
jgi:GTP-binding protein HflX